MSNECGLYLVSMVAFLYWLRLLDMKANTGHSWCSKALLAVLLLELLLLHCMLQWWGLLRLLDAGTEMSDVVVLFRSNSLNQIDLKDTSLKKEVGVLKLFK